jgi:hypothetical protein
MSDGNGQLTPEQVEALVREEFPTLKVDQGKIKLREWDDLEDAAGREVSPWVGVDVPPIWFMRGVLWLWLRRKHPARSTPTCCSRRPSRAARPPWTLPARRAATGRHRPRPFLPLLADDPGRGPRADH